MTDDMQEIEKQAEAQAWRIWQDKSVTWGNTESGAHAHGWVAGRDWARLDMGNALAATEAELATAQAERDAAARREAVADEQWYTWQMRAERAEAVALDYGRALRIVLDMAEKRAHKRITRYVTDVLGNGSEKARTSEHLTKWERETPLAPAAAVAEGTGRDGNE